MLLRFTDHEYELPRASTHRKPQIRLPLDTFYRGRKTPDGSINHFLSEFYYLCLGYKQGDRGKPSGPGIDAVFAGHAHRSIEFQLRRPPGAAADTKWKPQVYYGKFSEAVERTPNLPNRWWGPLLLQTGACGPPSMTDPHTPNFPYVTVDGNRGVTKLCQRQIP